MEASVKKQPLWKKPPVYSPLEEELPTKVKRPTDVTNGIANQERSTQEKLYDSTQS